MKSRILFIILCLLIIPFSLADAEKTEEAEQTEQTVQAEKAEKASLDKGLNIFKRDKKPKKIKVKPEKKKRQYKITNKVKDEYSIPTDVYLNVGDETDKKIKLSGGVTKSHVLNLADCIELALINNPKIRAAYENSEIAKYQKWETLAGYTPRLDWQTSINRQKPDLTMLRNMNITVDPFNKYMLGQIGIKQLVWDFGYTQNKYTIDKIEYEKSKTIIDQTVNEVVCEVKDAYYNLMYAFEMKKVAIDNLENYTTTYKQAMAFWEVGTTTKADVLFAQTKMEQSKADLITANNKIDIAYSRLNNAIGLPFVDPYMIDTSILYEPVEISMKEAIEIANESRPDLKGAMLDVDAADQAVKLSWKTFFPSLEFQANYATGGIDSFTDKDWYNYGGFLTFPTINPVLIRNQIKEAKAQYRKIQFEKKSQVNNIYFDIQSVYTTLKDAKAKIPVAKTSMEHAIENYDLVSGKYKVGYGNVIELMDAQSALSTAKSNYFQAIHQYNSARANMERAIGQTIKPEKIEKIESFQEL